MFVCVCVCVCICTCIHVYACMPRWGGGGGLWGNLSQFFPFHHPFFYRLVLVVYNKPVNCIITTESSSLICFSVFSLPKLLQKHKGANQSARPDTKKCSMD